MQPEKSPFEKVHITFRDVGRAVLDAVVDRFSNPYPLEPQRGAEAMLDQQLSFDDMGNWHDPDPYAYDVVQRPPENAGDWDSLRGV